MIPIYVNRSQIISALSIPEDQAKNVLARYRGEYRDEGRKLLDKYTIPTMYLIEKLSKDTGTPKEMLIGQFKKIGGLYETK